MMSRLIFLLFAFSLVATSVHAVTGGEVQVATNGQDSLERSSAYRTGLRWLLSNRPEAFGSIDREQVNAILNQAENYVDAFEFIELPDQQALASVPVTTKVREAGEVTHLLSIQYSVAAISAALSIDTSADTGVAQQRSLRTLNSMLIWMLIRDGNKDLIVSNSTTPEVASRLRELAGGFGWTIELPALDVTDLAFIGPDEIDTASQAEVSTDEPVGLTLSSELLQASQRYGQDLVLTGTAVKDPAGSWQLRVRRDFVRADTAIDQTYKAPLQADGFNLDRLLQQAMGWNAGLDATSLAGLRAAGQQGSDGVLSDTDARIYVAGVGGAREYLRLMRIVSDLAEVEETRALEIGQNSLMIGVSPRSALATVSSSLQSHDWLRLASRQQLQEQVNVSNDTLANPEPLSAGTTESESDSDLTALQPSTTIAPQQSEDESRLPAADLFLQVVK